MMERQLGQMVRLIDDLLDVSRISRNRLELRRETVELATVLRSAVETSRPLLEQSHHTLTLDIPAEPIPVDADVTRLAQVFSNLLNNAAKYTSPGGRIQLAVERRDDRVMVSVSDNGVGIPADMLERIFDMFTQVDHSLEKSHGGLGIGLTLVQRLVEMHGGTVTAFSDGHASGSRFVVELPVARPPLPGGGGEGAGAEEQGTPHRILVVDDNRDSAQMLARMLGILGNNTEVAHDGQEALRLAGEFRPDVILLDIGMPKMNGYDVARRIREEEWGRDMVLIALTGWGQEEDRRRSQEAGFDHHLLKPVEPGVLKELLARTRRA
jgi:CheY-like chemotaxis protein/two-component sensor histidine kinase